MVGLFIFGGLTFARSCSAQRHRKEDPMRLDKYLKVTRLIKRRTVANEACDAGKITVNGKVARASYDVKVGDLIEINMGAKPLKAEVLSINEYATKENAADNYRIVP